MIKLKKSWAFSISLLFFIIGVSLGHYYFESITFNEPFTIKKATMTFGERFDKFLSLFSNNIKVGLLSYIGGSLSFGLLTIALLIFNGYLLSNIYLTSLYSYQLDLNTVLSYLIHGPFELLGIIILSSVAFKNTQYLFRQINMGQLPQIESFLFHKEIVVGSLFIFIAAIIETAII